MGGGRGHLCIFQCLAQQGWDVSLGVLYLELKWHFHLWVQKPTSAFDTACHLQNICTLYFVLDLLIISQISWAKVYESIWNQMLKLSIMVRGFIQKVIKLFWSLCPWRSTELGVRTGLQTLVFLSVRGDDLELPCRMWLLCLSNEMHVHRYWKNQVLNPWKIQQILINFT